MSESEPKAVNRPRDERDELADLEAKLAQKRTEVEGLTNFGKYDGATVPNKGEVHYQGYLDQRPSEGIVRDGDSFREAHTGKFASEDGYHAQNSENTILDMLNNPGERPESNFDSMGKMELVKKAAEAAVLGDPAGVAEIRAAYEHNLMEEFTRDHTAGLSGPELDEEIKRQQGTDYSDEAYQKELQDFDEKVAKLAEARLASESGGAKESESGSSTDATYVESDTKMTAGSPGSGGEPVPVEGESNGAEGESGSGAEEEAPEGSDPSAEREKTGEPLFQKGDKVIYQGENGPEEVTIETAFMAADLSNEVVYRITLEDGSTIMVSEDQLSAVEAPVEEGAEATEPGADQPETDPEAGESEEKDTLRQKAVKGLKLLFGGANAWAAAWSTKKAIQRHTREEMTPEEIEAERKKNRIKYIAGGVVIFAAGVAAAVLVAKGLDDGQAQEAVKELAKQGAEGQAGLDWQIPNEFPINPGDGMTQGIQNALESVGRDLTPDQYADLHNTITNEYGPNYIINQGSPTNRMEVDPNSSFAPGVNEVIMRWMAANNIQ